MSDDDGISVKREEEDGGMVQRGGPPLHRPWGKITANLAPPDM
jgi:hypothetical protein